MRKARVFLSTVLILSQLTLFMQPAKAAESSGVVISQVQAASKSSSRFVELYNNTDESIDITDWCVRYVSANSDLLLNGYPDSVRVCFKGDTVTQRLIFPARSYVLVGSEQFKQDGITIPSDFTMTEGLGSGPSGKVYIVDNGQQLVDVFGWGDGTEDAEGVPKPYGGSPLTVYERKQSSLGVYVDERDNDTDFFVSILRSEYLIGSIVEVDDICQNLPEIQVITPKGLVLEDGWQCIQEQADLCNNMDGRQLALSPGLEVDDDNNCFQDICLNLPGFQSTAPAGFQPGVQKLTCSLGILPIQVTELLPNPDGSDKDNEFIELYNPNDIAVDLTYHVFHLSGDYVKTYSFPIGLTIEPHDYLAVYNKNTSFTLTNTLNSLRLRSFDNIHIVDVPEYSSAKSGEAWALIDDAWQYTNMPTPGAENIPSLVEQELMTAAFLTDCGEGRERNPLTKRCRNIVAAKSSVKPCRDGQYRSEETNRCRNITTAANAKPCKDNQYRSEETGRCRNLPVATVPAAGFAVQPVKESGMAFVGWWALGGVALLAGFYAAWEWRRELSAFVARLFRQA